MDKLKTLKDLHHETIDINKKHSEGIGCFITNAINVDLLKQEAIKHIKAHKKAKDGVGRMIDRCVEDWIKHFFNITEEDLK